MRASDLIKAIQLLQKDNGDLEVVFRDNSQNRFRPFTSAEVITLADDTKAIQLDLF